MGDFGSHAIVGAKYYRDLAFEPRPMAPVARATHLNPQIPAARIGLELNMSAVSQMPRLSVSKLRARKGGEPIVCLTAYAAPIANLLDSLVDLILVGDSAAMVVHGHDTTLPITNRSGFRSTCSLP